MSRRYAPYDDATQSRWKVPGYDRTFTRSPAQPFVARPLTLSEITGPARPSAKLALGHGDLSRLRPGAPRALGPYIFVQGRVADEDGTPVAGALLEIWQANAAGKYIHPNDTHDAPVDPNFDGTARLLTDAEGRFRFFSIKPGPYPVPGTDGWWRPPHIHFSVFAGSWMSRLVTQMFFPGEPLNEHDLILNAVPERAARERAVARALPATAAPENALGFEHEFVVRGRQRTPELP